MQALSEQLKAALDGPIKPSDLNGTVALFAAGATTMRKRKGEYDTEFVRRIVAAYLNAALALHVPPVKP